MRHSERKSIKPAVSVKHAHHEPHKDSILQLRGLAHDLSNSLEAILQACYLLGNTKLDGNGRRWVHLIDSSSQDAARINREIRKALRSLSGE